MSYWLMKSEPEEASILDLQRAGTLPWTGVRNYQARNFMRDHMQLGDGVLFYHSSCPEPGVAGLAEVCSAAYPDATQFDAKSPHLTFASDTEAKLRAASPRVLRAAERWMGGIYTELERLRTSGLGLPV